MQPLTTGIALDRFFARLRGQRERVLFVDYDGTLAPFHVRPKDAMPYPGVAQVLRELRSRGTRVVLVSGRCLADLRMPLEALHVDEAWGSHGWQRIDAQSNVVEYEPAYAARGVLEAAAASAAALTGHGARIERKTASVAVHWRGLSAVRASTIRSHLEAHWAGQERHDVHVSGFDGGIEMRARGRDKGDAVREVLARCSPHAACAYLGDDLTDEDAFAVLDGRGLGVLVRSAPRVTRAHAWVRPPVGLLTFLHRWRDATA